MFLPYYDIYNYPVVPPVRGRTLLLLGVSKLGPVNIPIPCANKTVAKRIFGDSELYKAFCRAYEVDTNITIYLMRVSGEHASSSLWADDMKGGSPVEAITLRSISGGEVFNDIQVTFSTIPDGNGGFPTALTFFFPPEANTPMRSYIVSEYETCNDLVRAINEDTRAGLNYVVASTRYKQYPATSIPGWNMDAIFTGGEDGDDIDKNALYLALEYSYSLLEGYYIDYVCPVGARFDDVHPAAYYGKAIYGTNIYEENRDYLSLQDSTKNNRLVSYQGQLIEFCKKQENLGCMTHGILGLNRVKDVTDLTKHEYSYIIRLLEASGFKNRYDLAEFRSGEWYDQGYYVSIVAGEKYYDVDTENKYHENLAVTYAAMLADLDPFGTTTNKTIPGTEELRYQFTANELRELADMGIVAPRESVRHGFVIANGVTASMPETEMHSVANVRQVQLTLSFLNEALDEYIGTPIRPLMESRTLEDVIENVLNSLKQDGILIDYNYNLEYDESRGIGIVTVDLQAKRMVERVTASSLLSFSA